MSPTRRNDEQRMRDHSHERGALWMLPNPCAYVRPLLTGERHRFPYPLPPTRVGVQIPLAFAAMPGEREDPS